ncbi:MAG: hypothetical protein ABIK86_01870 [candidate division WOR-3 bacterium]
MKSRQLLFLVPVLFALVACDEMVPDDGLTDLTGDPFNLNSNINVVAITGNPGMSPKGPFTLGMTISSKSSNVETDVLPAGLLLKRRKKDTQHMLLLKAHTITTGTSTKTELLGSFCCNKNRPSPDAGDTFDLGPVTDNPGLKQIVSLVQDKDISDGAAMWLVQRAVYLVTDSTGLTQAYIDSLEALPEETKQARRCYAVVNSPGRACFR